MMKRKQQDSDSPSKTPFFSPSLNHCCFNLIPCSDPDPIRPSSTPSFWHKIRTAESENKWWALPVRAFKKLREWSDRVAGPKWKTFIRRFKCIRGVSCAGGVLSSTNISSSHKVWHRDGGNFQYDEINYGLNFDEGQINRTDEVDRHYPDFTSRYAVSGGAMSMKHLMGSSREVNPVGG